MVGKHFTGHLASMELLEKGQGTGIKLLPHSAETKLAEQFVSGLQKLYTCSKGDSSVKLDR